MLQRTISKIHTTIDVRDIISILVQELKYKGIIAEGNNSTYELYLDAVRFDPDKHSLTFQVETEQKSESGFREILSEEMPF